MNITVLFFGMATDLSGEPNTSISVDTEMNLEEFKARLFEIHPKLKTMQQFAIAINEEYAEEHSTIKPGDTIAIIPPVSGG